MVRPSLAPATRFDVIIVGAGPAGLSAALVLGRSRRNVLLFDDGGPRNLAARRVHGFFTREDATPSELRELGLAQLRPYPVVFVERHITSARIEEGSFVVRADGDAWCARKLLLATGMRDFEPEIPGLRELVGRGVHHCPYCDGWENRDRRLGCIGPREDGPEGALGLLTWSHDVSLFTQGTVIEPAVHARLERHGVRIYEARIRALEPDGEGLRAVHLESGERVLLDALFVHAGQEQRSPLIEGFGCELAPNQAARTEHRQRTRTPGLYIAGDAAVSVQSVAVAAAEGYIAAVTINRELRQEQFP
ncbi:MAG: NAD(P)/FAD-dependent oxidoreductase [Polyangiaceae bacterium]